MKTEKLFNKIPLLSVEYQCWHEVGHAVTCHLYGGEVELIEIIDDKESVGVARARCLVNDSIRKSVSCGGFAAEFLLFAEQRLNATAEEFMNEALRNATLDMHRYFGRNMVQPNGIWPEKYIQEFTLHAGGEISKQLIPHMELMEALVSELIAKRKLERDEIYKHLLPIPPKKSDEPPIEIMPSATKLPDAFNRFFRWVRQR